MKINNNEKDWAFFPNTVRYHIHGEHILKEIKLNGTVVLMDTLHCIWSKHGHFICQISLHPTPQTGSIVPDITPQLPTCGQALCSSFTKENTYELS